MVYVHTSKSEKHLHTYPSREYLSLSARTREGGSENLSENEEERERVRKRKTTT